MFDSISPRYDFLNHVLSMGIDIRWRNKALKHLKPVAPKQILDVATGTGDFAIQALDLHPDKVTGIDISNGMLEVGREKINKKGLSDRIELLEGDSENIPFDSNTLDAVTVACGVRNFEHLDKGLADIHRVLKPGGRAVVLEFSNPTTFPVKQLYRFYSSTILPWVGKKISKHDAAYAYLPESVRAFPEGDRFLDVMRSVGFSKVNCVRLSFGIASIYTGDK